MNSPEIDTLIKFLRSYGGSIISGHTKFSITPSILKQINAVTENIKQDFYVSPLTNKDLIEKYVDANDLMFLYEFVRKTPKLKISNTITENDFHVDVIDFGNLTYLELYKCNVKRIKNVSYLRENLEMIVCVRSLDNVSDLLLCSQSNGEFIWSKLKHAVFSRNTISKLDQSFIHTPWLQYLDLSYNRLTDLHQLACLQYLTYLNVSYNALTQVPKFPMYKLRTLLLNNNHITDISGISKLESLQELDLAQNCITTMVDLLPLSELPVLRLLTVSKNPVCHHAMYRSLTCGYLHENAANESFLLDGKLLTPAEREFIRHCSRTSLNTSFAGSQKSRTCSTSSCEAEFPSVRTLVEKSVKEVREPVIIDAIVAVAVTKDMRLRGGGMFVHSTPNEHDELSRSNMNDYLEMKKEIEVLRRTYGDDGWLHGAAASKVENLLNISREVVHSSYKEDAPVWSIPSLLNDEITNEEITIDAHDETPAAAEECTAVPRSPSVMSTDSEEESDYESDIEGPPLWPVTRIHSNSKEENVFLVLSDTELKEKTTNKNELIARWDINAIDRCIKISSDPPTIELHFNVIQRNKIYRKYVMEYSDAETLVHNVGEIIARKSLKEFNQKLLHCIKCDFLWCHEISKRKSIGFVENETVYKCPTCGSKAVIEEEEKSVLPAKRANEAATPKSTPVDDRMKSKVTTSPSMSSIGSAASLELNTEMSNNGDSTTGNPESDVEIISNPSQSSIEVLEIHGSDNTKTVLKQPNGINSSNNSSSVYLSASNQLLTESSSSGSMTDSICTSYETNSHLTRGSHRISQSTVDEVLIEESSSETSPQQRRSEEKTTASECEPKSYEKKYDFTAYIGDVIQSVGSKIIQASSPRKSSILGTTEVAPCEYSYTDFTFIDHRLKFLIWDQVVPTNEEITAFVRVNVIAKVGSSSAPFPGFLVFTTKKLYIIKITKEKEENINEMRIQESNAIAIDKVKLIQSVVWKQGFSIHIEDVANGSSCKYVAMLFNTTRTSNFLSFVRDLGAIHVLTSDDASVERDLNDRLDVDEDIEHFVASESISIYKDDVKLHSLNFGGLVATDSRFIIVKGDIDWVLLNSTVKPTKLTQEPRRNILNMEEDNNMLKLEFSGETEGSLKRWLIKTVPDETDSRIENAVRKPLRDLMKFPLSKRRFSN